MNVPPAKLSDLLLALEMDSDEMKGWFDRQSGKVVWVDESVYRRIEDGDEDVKDGLPDWEKEEVDIARAEANHVAFVDDRPEPKA